MGSSLWLLLTLLAWAQLAKASVERVRVTYAIDHAQEPSLRETLQAALDLPDLTMNLARAANVDPRSLLAAESDPSAPVARIWLDLTHSDRAFVYILDRSGMRIYIRAVPRDANVALEHAQIGEIVRSAVQALVDGAVIGIVREDAERSLVPSVTPPPPAPSKHSGSFGAGMLYGLGLRAREYEIAHGPGLYAYGMTGSGRTSWGATLVGQYQPLRIARDDAAARLHTILLRAGPLLDLALNEQLGLRASVAGGLEVVRLNPAASGAMLQASEARLLTYPSLQAALGLRFRSRGQLELALSLTVDLDLAATRYVLRDGNSTVTVDDPWTLRPSLVTSLGFF